MKKYELSLENYTVGTNLIDAKKEMSEMLRLPGIYDDGMGMVDGVILAKEILNCEGESIELDKNQLANVKKVMNRLINRPHNPTMGQISLGGQKYEDLVMRVFTIEE